MDKLQIKFATEQDAPIILKMIKELAEFENLSHKVTATNELLIQNVFKNNHANVIIGYYEEEPVCFSLFFYNFSTFLCKPGLYIEDVYVKESMRGKGIGKKIFRFLANVALEKGCARMEWACLDWNENAQNFYYSLGAKTLDEWKINRLEEKEIQKLSEI